MKGFLRSTACVLALAVGACSTPTPTGITPDDVPKGYTAPIPAGVQVWPATGWWKNFTSAELAGLEDEAQTNNLDLAAAAARVLQAQAQTGITGSALFPDIFVNGTANRSGGTKPTPTTNSFSG